MKTSVCVAALVLFANHVTAQKITEQQVPDAVLKSFKAAYKDVKVEKWEKEGANFEAEFEVNKVEQSVVLDASGAVLETETEIPVTDLPASVNTYLTKNYKGAKIKEASRIVDAAGISNFEVGVGKDDLVFDESGNYLRKETDEDKDGDKD